MIGQNGGGATHHQVSHLKGLAGGRIRAQLYWSSKTNRTFARSSSTGSKTLDLRYWWRARSLHRQLRGLIASIHLFFVHFSPAAWPLAPS
jgi:hypothetical protein